MKAVVVTGGKQYYVEEGTELYVEKLDVEPGKKVELDNVLMVNDTIGTPCVKGAKVVCEVLKHGKNKKVIIYKYRQKKHTLRTQGHRQPYTKLVVKKIEA